MTCPSMIDCYYALGGFLLLESGSRLLLLSLSWRSPVSAALLLLTMLLSALLDSRYWRSELPLRDAVANDCGAGDDLLTCLVLGSLLATTFSGASPLPCFYYNLFVDCLG